MPFSGDFNDRKKNIQLISLQAHRGQRTTDCTIRELTIYLKLLIRTHFALGGFFLAHEGAARSTTSEAVVWIA